jgi:hypothetical protein
VKRKRVVSQISYCLKLRWDSQGRRPIKRSVRARLPFQNLIVSEGAGRLGKALLNRRFRSDLRGNLLEGARRHRMGRMKRSTAPGRRCALAD